MRIGQVTWDDFFEKFGAKLAAERSERLKEGSSGPVQSWIRRIEREDHELAHRFGYPDAK